MHASNSNDNYHNNNRKSVKFVMTMILPLLWQTIGRRCTTGRRQLHSIASQSRKFGYRSRRIRQICVGGSRYSDAQYIQCTSKKKRILTRT